MSRRVLGHQMSLFGPEVPIYGRPTRTSRQSSPRVTPPEDDFITVYHSSDSPAPPHVAPHPYGEFGDLERPESTTKHMFAGTLRAASAFFRPYMHTYRVPKSAVYPLEYSDDSEAVQYRTGMHDLSDMGFHEHQGMYTTPAGLKAHPDQPQLWAMFAVRRGSAQATKSVVPYRNSVEGIDPVTGRGQLSYVMPKGELFDRLGIQYTGMTDERQSPTTGEPMTKGEYNRKNSVKVPEGYYGRERE